jgi:hypothetical protein
MVITVFEPSYDYTKWDSRIEEVPLSIIKSGTVSFSLPNYLKPLLPKDAYIPRCPNEIQHYKIERYEDGEGLCWFFALPESDVHSITKGQLDCLAEYAKEFSQFVPTSILWE